MDGQRPILFCCTHSVGEANTSLAIAAELARRGVPDLWFASDENQEAAVKALADRSAVEFVSLGEVNPRVDLMSMDDAIYDQIMHPSRTKSVRARTRHLMDVDHHFDRYRKLDELVRKIEPVLMVINRFCRFGIEVALAHEIPYVVTAPCLPSSLLEGDLPTGYPRPSTGFPLRMTRFQKLRNKFFGLATAPAFLHPNVLREIAKYRKHAAELNLDSTHSRTSVQLGSAELLLCFSVFGLDYHFPVPQKLRLLGAMIPPLRSDPLDAGVQRWLDDQRSVVYTAFGSVTRLNREQVRSMVDVVRRLGDRHQVLWVLSTTQQRLLPAPDELPANLRVESWIHNQHGVLAHPNVEVFFTHGGSNSFHEGVYFGKPLLVRPICIDQYDHVARAEDSGVGLGVGGPNEFDADEVHVKLERLLTEPSFRARAQHFAQVQQDAGGLELAGDLVLQQAAGIRKG